jgi:hypothetical protein
MSELYLDHPAAAADTDLFDGRWTATIVSASPLLARQDGGATNLIVLNGMPDRQHVAGDRVKLQRFGSDLLIMAALTPRPQFGTVVSVNTGTRTAVISTASAQWSVRWSVQYVGAAPTVADRISIMWGPEGGVILGSVSTTVTPPASTDPGSAGAAPSSGGTLTVKASQAGTYRSGAHRTDNGVGTKLYQGHWTAGSSADNAGILCYGDVFGGLSGKTIASSKLTITRGPRGTGADGAVTFYVVAHAAMTLPGSTPGFSSAVTISLAPGQTGTVDVTSIASGLNNGTVRGFGISYSGTAQYGALLGPDELVGAGTLVTVYA